MNKLEQGLDVLVKAIAELRKIRKDVSGLSGIESRLKEARMYFEEHNEEEITPYLRGYYDGKEHNLKED
jgi:hypothetical protein